MQYNLYYYYLAMETFSSKRSVIQLEGVSCAQLDFERSVGRKNASSERGRVVCRWTTLAVVRLIANSQATNDYRTQ